MNIDKTNEEIKRERAWDPLQRWKALQATIAWADAQQPIQRNSRAGCLAAQRRIISQGQ